MPQGESNKFVYERRQEVDRTHKWYDGTQHPWEFKRVWHLEPSLTDPDTVYAGVEDAAVFKTVDGGKTWKELSGLRGAKGTLWQPGAGGMAVHTILLDPKNPNRIFIAISAAGAFRTDDGGKTWKPINRGLKSQYELGDPDAEVGHCVHRIAMHPIAPERAVHAKALGRDAERRRRRIVARSQREPADGFRVSDRCARPRAGDGVRRADQKRLRAFSSRRKVARVPQPDGRERVGSAHERSAAAAIAT